MDAFADGPHALNLILEKHMKVTLSQRGVLWHEISIYDLDKHPKYHSVEFNVATRPHQYTHGNAEKVVAHLNYAFGEGTARFAEAGDYQNGRLPEGKIVLIVSNKMIQPGVTRALISKIDEFPEILALETRIIKSWTGKEEIEPGTVGIVQEKISNLHKLIGPNKTITEGISPAVIGLALDRVDWEANPARIPNNTLNEIYMLNLIDENSRTPLTHKLNERGTAFISYMHHKYVTSMQPEAAGRTVPASTLNGAAIN